MAEPKAKNNGDADPSMEEILSSIRRIIAEDDKKEEPRVNAPDDFGSDVLDLTEVVGDNDEIVETAVPPADVMASINNAIGEAPAPAAPALSGQSAIDSMFDDAPAVVAPPPPPPPPPPAPKVEVKAPEPALHTPVLQAPEADDEKLLSDQAAAASSAELKKLVPPKKAPPPGEPVMPFRAGLTVEDLVQEMLRPMMKEWLDKNLPPIVQHIVEKEIKKLTTD